ncbi:MAG: hypothetical protein PVJ08_01770 [Dehalococcoidia bacterium]
MAPLQKRAWWGLGVGLAFTIAFVLVFILMGGIENFDTDQTFRIIINALWIGGLVAHLVIMDVTLRKAVVDERDKMIRDRAPRIQWIAVIFTLAGWVIGLNEVYQETSLIPATYLYVMFMSVLVASWLALSLGIIIGYWRANRNG